MLNNVACPNVIISFGTTAYSNYVVDFFDEDNQSDDAFDQMKRLN